MLNYRMPQSPFRPILLTLRRGSDHTSARLSRSFLRWGTYGTATGEYSLVLLQLSHSFLCWGNGRTAHGEHALVLYSER